jgi:transcriptional regulator with XRE-family HTH domain
MGDVLTATDIEALAWRAGLSMAEVCRRAGIAQSTFTRWKAGRTEPTLDAYRRLFEVVKPDDRASAEPAQEYAFPERSFAERPGPQPLGVHEPVVPFQFARDSGGHPSRSAKADAEAAEAAEILARVHRELAIEETRAGRLLRLYNR